MKLSHRFSRHVRYVAVVAFALSTAPLVAQAQTSQTYRFGEGQSSLQPVPKSAQQTAPQSAPQVQQSPQAQQPQQTVKPAKRPAKQRLKKHRRHMTRRLPDQSLYSHP